MRFISSRIKVLFLSLFGFQPGHLVSFSFIIITIIFKKKGVTNRPFRTPKLLLGVRRWSLLKLSVEPSWTWEQMSYLSFSLVWFGSVSKSIPCLGPIGWVVKPPQGYFSSNIGRCQGAAAGIFGPKTLDKDKRVNLPKFQSHPG